MPCVFLKSRSWKSVSRGEGSEQGLTRARARGFAERDTAAPGPGNGSPAPSSLLQMRTAPLGDFLPCLLLLLPRPPVCLPFPLFSLEAPAVALHPASPASERAEKSLALKKKKKSQQQQLSDLSSLLPALSKLEQQTGFRSPSSSFLCSGASGGCLGCNRSPAVLSSRACLPCPKT